MSSPGGENFLAAKGLALPLLDEVNDQITVIDSAYCCRFANPAACAKIQAPADQIVGRHLARLIGQTAFDLLKPSFDRGFAGETDLWSDWMDLGDGERVFFECRILPCRGADGTIIGVTNIARDLTAWAEKEQKQEQSEQRFKDFAEIASDWLWEMDADLRFCWFSDNVEEKTGVPAAWHYGKTRAEIASPDIDPAVLKMHLDVLNAHQPYRDFRLVRRGPDGDRWISSNGNPIFDRSGRFLGYRGTGTDITAEVRAEQAAAKQQELETALAEERALSSLQRQFIAMVSHEFRTPLAIIDGNAHRLLRHEDKLSPAMLRQAVGKIRGSVTRMTRLMESVLSLSRLESGQVEFEPSELSLRDHLAEICGSYADLSPDHEIRVDTARITRPLFGDERQVSQILSNLLSNAVKYSPTGTIITVDAWQEDSGFAVIAVGDQGVGIPADEIETLFDCFFRASTSTGIAGTGIGLHLVRELVDMHGGSIEVDSTVGQGSTFTVRLPLAVADDQRPSPPMADRKGEPDIQLSRRSA
ncbi:MAG: ATP-binding protein [Alphaproteobacteria bacterium]|nr:ATP-binding protein [Alphaproteobacteria bacterium]